MLQQKFTLLAALIGPKHNVVPVIYTIKRGRKKKQLPRLRLRPLAHLLLRRLEAPSCCQGSSRSMCEFAFLVFPEPLPEWTLMSCGGNARRRRILIMGTKMQRRPSLCSSLSRRGLEEIVCARPLSLVLFPANVPPPHPHPRFPSPPAPTTHLPSSLAVIKNMRRPWRVTRPRGNRPGSSGCWNQTLLFGCFFP